MNAIPVFESRQFKMSLTEYNFISIEQEIPFMKNNAIINLSPDDVSDFVQAIKDLKPAETENIAIGKYLFTVGDNNNSMVIIFDNEKYEEDEDQFINLHYDQSDMFIKWILELKKIAVENIGFDTIKIKTPPTK